MDRPLDRAQQRRRRIALALRIGIPAAVLVAGVQLLLGRLSPSVDRGSIRTAVVEYGAVESVVTAGGTVVPEREVVLPSAVNARIMRVLRRAGDSVRAGEAIVLLDVSEARAQLARLVDRIALKRNEQLQIGAALEGQLARLESAIAVKKREVEFNTVKDMQNRAAWEKEFIAANELQESAIVVERSRSELAGLEKERDIARRTGQLQQEGLVLELSLLHKEREELEQQIAFAAPASDRTGVLTWVTQTEGVIVHRGDILARIADLSSYRVQGTVSDAHASQISVGMPARVQTGTTVLHGTITSIQPAVENGSVVFTVGLGAGDAALLRPNLRVEVHIITGSRSRALRVKRGAVLWRNGGQELFILRSARAVRTPVAIGMAGAEHYEILHGVSPGDTVIISPMDDYLALREVEVR